MAGAGGSGGGILRELIAVFGFEVDAHGLAEGESKLGEFFGKLRKYATAFAELFAIHEIVEFAEANVRAMTEIEHAASRLSISTDAVQAYQFAAKAMGLEGEQLLNLMGRLQVAQEAAAHGGQEQAKTFKSIGIGVSDLRGKAADQLFEMVADGIAKQGDASRQAAAATKLFGRAGRELLPLLKEGSKGIRELVKQYFELGGGYSEKAIKASKAFEHQSARTGLVIKNLKSVISAALLPILTAFSKGIERVVFWFNEFAKESEIVKATLIVLAAAATAFGIHLAISFAPVLLVAAALAALVLIVDDLIVMFEGGDSAIADAIDKMFGKDAHLDVVIALRDAWHEVGAAIKTSWEYAVKFFDKLTEYGGALGDFLARADNAFGEPAQKASVEIGANRVRAKLRGQQDTVKARADATNKIEREVFGGQGATPDNPITQSRAPGDLYTVPDFAPLTGGAPPANYVNAPSSSGNMNVTQNIYAAPGMNEEKIAKISAQELHKLRKQERRAAKATFQTAPAQK